MNSKEYDAELRDYIQHAGYYHGRIYNDSKGRFSDGTLVNTTKKVNLVGDILTTKNTKYKLS
jgi:hypothetical protein